MTDTPSPGQRAYEAFLSERETYNPRRYKPRHKPWSECTSLVQLGWERIALAALPAKKPRPQKPLPFFFYHNGRSIERVQLANCRVYKGERRLVKHADGSTSHVRTSRLLSTARAVARAEVRQARSSVTQAKARLRVAERGLVQARKL